MDSEQIKKNIPKEPVVIINELIQQESPQSQDQEIDTRKLKGQLVAQPVNAGLTSKKPTPSTLDPWQQDSEAAEQRLLTSIVALAESSNNDKLELKKKLAGLYKQTHELMTRFNQRVQSLLMDDRFLYRHSSEISALMIRGLMPPLEVIKTLEKGLTSTKKKHMDESAEAVQKAAQVELKKVAAVLQEVKERIIKNTKPLKASQIIQKQLHSRLDEEAKELKKQLPEPGFIKATTPIGVKLASSGSGLASISREAAKKITPDDIITVPLKALAEQFNTTDTDDTHQSLLNYLEAEYQQFFPLQPLISVAIKKCDLIGMIADKACKSCLSALVLLEERILSLKETQNDHSPMETIGQVDQAIVKLTAFNKKLPGEVWQLLTELTPRSADNRYHLLNILCRKFLLDASTTLTNKPTLSWFKDVETLLTLLQEEVDDSVFDPHFLAVYGPVFSTPSVLKKALVSLNKPDEINVLLQVFQRVCQADFEQLSSEYARAAANYPYSQVLFTGLKAYEFLVGELMSSAAAEIDHFSLSEPGNIVKNLIQSLQPKLMDFFRAVEFMKNQSNKNREAEFSAIAQSISNLKTLFAQYELHDNVVSVINGLNNATGHPPKSPQMKYALTICQRNFVALLQNAHIDNEAFITFIRQFLNTQSMMNNPETLSAPAGKVEFPPAIMESIQTLQSSMSPRWYNQRFIGQVQERRAQTLAIVNSLVGACEETTAGAEQAAGLATAVAQEAVQDCDDPLIKQLASAIKSHVGEIQLVAN